MNEQYQHDQEMAVRTEPSTEDYLKADGRLNPNTMRLLHAGMGLCTEVGELMDQLKRHIFYGKELDKVNLFEEGGDISWYLRILADALSDLRRGQCSFEQMIANNIAKLKIRFPGKFNEEQAINRDLTAERRTLENGGL